MKSSGSLAVTENYPVQNASLSNKQQIYISGIFILLLNQDAFKRYAISFNQRLMKLLFYPMFIDVFLYILCEIKQNFTKINKDICCA